MNKVFNAETYFRVSDSLHVMQIELLKRKLEAYDMVLGIDTLKDGLRVDQIRNWKIGFDGQKTAIDQLKGQNKYLSAEVEKQTKRKTIWKRVSLYGIPIAFVGGFILAPIIILHR